eukprot:9257626-Pyramimonas_sp.AAC.1
MCARPAQRSFEVPHPGADHARHRAQFRASHGRYCAQARSACGARGGTSQVPFSLADFFSCVHKHGGSRGRGRRVAAR